MFRRTKKAKQRSPNADGPRLSREEGENTMELSQSSMPSFDKAEVGGQTPCLLVVQGPAVGQLFRIGEDPLIIGRSKETQLCIDDDGISRRHAVILQEDNNVRIQDLGSTNGMFINGEKKSDHWLCVGDQIRIGASTVFKFRFQDPLDENFQRQMYDSAMRDSLTLVFNRRYFLQSLSSEFSYFQRHEMPFSVLMLDIDHFKAVNDTYGHLAGDNVLKGVASLIEQDLRSEDVLCRYGGEEFAVLLRATDACEAVLVAERIRMRVERAAFQYDDRSISVTVSIGTDTLFLENLVTPTELLEKADQCLYRAKRAGRNRTVGPLNTDDSP